ncbi:Dual specificity phosphatase, catalytic domain containing protein [Tritrichomonas foetus]|uniref:protein-tyrosine-phosphatase n=1 Tax=Tritrichomonas foetus TaxID=1144522 RepID=A0A1J4JJN6_9EUKA|nr:Dual specificity phosphatase, catalytic domain containing protein [Tritrichomonas foetus]|eukprot:OHS97731.1 Dual specificity phosphatase, catalytic domain containing protein [Tritrichomonas foetus]
MGQVFSVEHTLCETQSNTKAVMILLYENHDFKPLSILDFVRAPASFSGKPIIIVEPLNPSNTDEIPFIAGQIKDKLSYTDTMRAIHTIYKLTPYQFKEYRLWLLVSPTISQNMISEVLNFSRRFPFGNFTCNVAAEASNLFFDMKSFHSFSSAIRPPSAGIRCSSPIRSNNVHPTGLYHVNRSHAAPLSTTFSQSPHLDEIPTNPNYNLTNFTNLNGIITNNSPNIIDYVDTGLYIGSEAAAQDRELLSQNQITHIINLNGHNTTPAFPGSFEYFTVKMSDNVFEVLDEKFWNALEFLKNAIKNNGKVLVHCRRGISRSAALCVAYLMDTKKISYDEAFSYLKSHRLIVNINQGFVEQLKAREYSCKQKQRKFPPLLNLSKR